MYNLELNIDLKDSSSFINYLKITKEQEVGLSISLEYKIHKGYPATLYEPEEFSRNRNYSLESYGSIC